MNFNRSTQIFALLTVLAVIVVGGVILIRPVAAETEAPKAEVTLVSYDVAEDMSRFIFDESKTFEDGLPAYGSGFVTQGWIYPEGTLDGTNGTIVNEDGTVEPEFPELVLGEWTCYGYMIGDGAHTQAGAWVISTQVYSFGDEVGEETIITTGYELADLDKNIERAIVGGTGQYSHVSGEMHQELIGFNQSEGVDLRVEFEMTDVVEEMMSAE